jgi:hypothetical protein
VKGLMICTVAVIITTAAIADDDFYMHYSIHVTVNANVECQWACASTSAFAGPASSCDFLWCPGSPSFSQDMECSGLCAAHSESRAAGFCAKMGSTFIDEIADVSNGGKDLQVDTYEGAYASGCRVVCALAGHAMAQELVTLLPPGPKKRGLGCDRPGGAYRRYQ